MKIDITKLLAANVFASTEEVRHYLNGVLFEVKSGKASFVSTDGHRMIVLPLDIPEGETWADCAVIIPSWLIKQIKPMRGIDDAEISIGENITINYGSMVLNGVAIDGTFPDYTRILPGKNEEEKGSALIGFNPSYLGDFAKAHKILGKKNAHIHMVIYSADHAVKITSPGLDYTAILMPVRTV